MAISENNRWHASWIIPSLIAVGVAWATAGTGLEMTPLIVIIVTGWILSVALLWIVAPQSRHLIAKVLITVILSSLAGLAIRWVVKDDRPILQPQIGGIASQNYNGTQFALDVETLIQNAGRQDGYADKWNLVLTIDGTEIEGKQLFGQQLPPRAVSEPEIYNQEFPPGKPVRGWLFFAFPMVSHEFAAPYFSCGSPSMNKVSVKLSVWDSKTKHEWSQLRSLKELGKESCNPIEATPPSIGTAVPPHKSISTSKSTPSSQPTAPTLPTPAPIVTGPNCPNGICPTAPNFGTQQVTNNQWPPPLQLTVSDPVVVSNDGKKVVQYITLRTNVEYSPVSLMIQCGPSAINDLEVGLSSMTDITEIQSNPWMIYWDSPPISPTRPTNIYLQSERPLQWCNVQMLPYRPH
jgi:hypothetical protein